MMSSNHNILSLKVMIKTIFTTLIQIQLLKSNIQITLLIIKIKIIKNLKRINSTKMI